MYVLAEKGSITCVTYGALPAFVPKQTHDAARYKEDAADSCVILWNSMMKRPYEATDLAVFVTKRTLQLRPKSQIDIAQEAGFQNPNFISMLKNGAAKLPLDRVLALATALECDPKRLFLLALQQQGYETEQTAIADIFGTVVTRNEVIWLEELRDASGRSDPSLTSRSRAALRGIFSK